MNANVKSVLTAATIAALMIGFCVRVIAPKLPPVVGKADVQEKRDFVHTSPGALRLENTDGLVRIATVSGETISGKATIRAYRRGATTEDELKQYVSALVDVREDSGVLLVRTEPTERTGDYDLFVEYDIRVPEGTNVEVTSNNGNVWVRPGCGDIRVLGRNSDVEIAKPLGTVDVQSVNGRIRVIEAPAGGTLRTVNGDVYAAVQGGALEAETDNGVIRAEVLGPGVQRARLTSHNGGVTLLMADSVSASIEARASRGTITSEMPIDTARGAQQRRYLAGVIGDGRAQINLDTLNGNILIARSN